MMSRRHLNLLRNSMIILLTVTLYACSGNSSSAEDEAPFSLEVSERPRGISTGDLNGDGHVDIVVANADSNTITTLLQGRNVYEFLRSDYAAGNEPSDIELGDFDRDGDLDAAVANHETSNVTILLNDGAGAFVPAAGSPFDTKARPHLHGLAVGDFDGDGWLDIGADSSDSDVVTVLRGGRGGFRLGKPLDVGRFPYYRIDAYQIDGGTDILVPSPRANRVRQVGTARSGHSRSIIVGDAIGAMMAISADLNGDAMKDVVAVMNGGVAMWTAKDGGFSPLPDTPVLFETPTEIAAGDITGDGLDEIVVGLWDDSKIYILSSNGEQMRAVPACFRPVGLEVSDLNADGYAEVLVGCWREAKIIIFDWTDLQIKRQN